MWARARALVDLTVSSFVRSFFVVFFLSVGAGEGDLVVSCCGVITRVVLFNVLLVCLVGPVWQSGRRRRLHCLLMDCNVCAVHRCWWCHWQDVFCKCLFLTFIIIDILLFICTWKFIQGYVTWISIGTRESVHFM